jgi:hypothetical protein
MTESESESVRQTQSLRDSDRVPGPGPRLGLTITHGTAGHAGHGLPHGWG